MHHTFSIDGHTLALWLRAFRERMRISCDDVDMAAKEELGALPKSARCEASQSLIAQGSQGFEAKTHAKLNLTVDDLELLARAYRVPRLVLDPLVSEVSVSPCVVSSFDRTSDDFREIPVSELSGPSYGSGAVYRCPARILAGTSAAAVVHLMLEPEGISDTHAHPGDELMLVLRGEIEVHLEANGLPVRLRQWEFAHFYAEQLHSAWNPNKAEQAEVLVIRFYQLTDGMSSRESFLNSLPAAAGTWSPTLLQRASIELREAAMRYHLPRDTIAPYQQPASTLDEGRGDDVQDPFGLGRLLRLACSERFRGKGRGLSLSELAELSSGSELEFSRSKLDRIHRGLARVGRTELQPLADLYELQPLLLYHYMFPARRNAIAVGLGNHLPERHRRNDWRHTPEDMVSERGVRYFVPPRRLADSDIAVAMLEFDSPGDTPENGHPGHELLIPMEGDFEIRFGQLSTEISAEDRVLAHYHSSHLHSVHNRTKGPARLLVVRFYE